MVYVTDGLTSFSMGAGYYIQKVSGTTTKCFLKAFVNEHANPNAENYHFVTCNPAPSGSITATVLQASQNSKTWTGYSGSYSQTYTFTVDAASGPNYLGAVAGSLHNDLSLPGHFAVLKAAKWGGTDTDFSVLPGTTYKCWTDTSYKYDLIPDNNINEYKSGPGLATVDECTGAEADNYRPHGEWD
jgi:hypothetical protein